MSLKNEQALHRISTYIESYIEPHVSGLNWHTRISGDLFKVGVPGMGTIFLFFSSMPLLLPIFVLSHRFQDWPATLILVPFFCWAIYGSLDAYCPFSKQWHLKWKLPTEGSESADD